MPKITINGASLEYVECGTGDPVVLVHGSASDYRTMLAPQGTFCRRFRTIAYSRRYHWPNEPIPEGADYSMTEHLGDLAALLDALGAAPAHLVGHSYGALLCLMLAIGKPGLVRTLVLAEPPAITLFVSNAPKPLELLRLLVTRPRTAAAVIRFGATGMAPAAAAAKRGDTDKAMQIFGRAVLGHAFHSRLPETRLAQVRANTFRAEFVGSGFLPLPADRVGSVRVPVLLITGARSPALFHRLADRLEELLPDTERAEIPAASHILHEDNPPAYNAVVLSFLSRHQQDD